MQPTPRTTAALVLAALGLAVLAAVVPTGAVLPSDRVWADQSIVLEPHDGPNGAYAAVGADGNLSVDLAGNGANADADSRFADVFDVSNRGTVPTRVWLTHGATDRVSFAVGDGTRIDGPSRSVVLSPGERRSVSILLHTDGVAPGTTLLQTVAVHAEPTATTTPTTTTTTSGGSGGGSGSSGGTTATTTTPSTTTPTPTTPDSNETVEVELDDDGDAGDADGGGDADGDGSSTGDDVVTVVELDVDDLGDGEGGDAGPRAVIVPGTVGTSGGDDDGGDGATGGDDGVTGGDGDADGGIRANGSRAVSVVNETVTLSGANSLVGSVDAVDSQRRIVKAVDIQVPASRADRPGTVRIRVSRAKFGDSDPSAARIGHLEDGGWQLLPTRIVGETDEHLELEARTPGFSPFAVFADTEVRFEWTIDGRSYVGEDVEHAFTTPGSRAVNLTVTDAFGRADTAVYRILVNDVPRVTLDVPGNVTVGEPVRLRADVRDEVGNATATWTFPDGTEATGFEVEHAFEPGEQVVRVTVADEYGASTTVERTVVVGSGDDRLVVGPAGRDVPVLLVALLAVLLAGLGWLVRPRWPAAVAARARAHWTAVASRHGPRIERFDAPVVEPASRRFAIPALAVADPAGDLATVEVAVRDADGFEVGATAVHLDGVSSYVAEPQTVEPRSRVYVTEGRTYSVRVRATDRDGDETERVRHVDVARDGEADDPVPSADGSPGRRDPGFAGTPAGD